MLDTIALPVVCAPNACLFAKWFVLKENEKFLWLWLATICANNPSFCCSLSYEQISLAVNKSEKEIHRALFRLKIMGLLLGDIPIWYGPPTQEMVKVVREMRLVVYNPAFIGKQIGGHTTFCPPYNRNSTGKQREKRLFAARTINKKENWFTKVAKVLEYADVRKMLWMMIH